MINPTYLYTSYLYDYILYVSTSRVPYARVLIDWNADGIYIEEEDRNMVVEVERKISEPLGGVAMAQADIQLVNTDGRYT